MQSQLNKKGKRRSLFGDAWNYHYVVLDAPTHILRCYAGDSAAGPLEAEATVAGISPRNELQGAKGHKPYRFDIVTKDGRMFAMSALMATTRQEWLDAVATTMMAGGGGGSGGGGGAAAAAAAPPQPAPALRATAHADAGALAELAAVREQLALKDEQLAQQDRQLV